jgi:pimeloyl-ACP methyl ester carboxylesterase
MVRFRRGWCLLALCDAGALSSVANDALSRRSSSATLLDQDKDNTLIVASTWMFQGHQIAYECRKASTKSQDVLSPTPLLLLNGFGMGSFHQHRLMNALFANVSTNPRTTVGDKTTNSFHRDVYGLDYLGQGNSWPIDCDDGNAPSEQGLRYCAETWLHQIIGFIENVVPQKKVHLVGNSVGGYLAVFVAALRPDLVESVALTNATPIWGLNLPFWSGHLPAPSIPKAIGSFLFDRIRDETTIRRFLNITYANPEAFDDSLIRQVRRCTEGKGGHAAFASILWSPPLRLDNNKGFYDCLAQVQCDVLLCFGSNDPWCKPAFGRRMLQTLQQRAAALTQTYVELSDVGHCPNHEAPRATASVLCSWMNGNREFSRQRVSEAWGDTFVNPKGVDEIQVSLIDKLKAMLL